jgi:charged multivesicular body protein 1
VQSEYVEKTINQTTALSTPQEQVDTLIAQVADENGLELGEQLGQVAKNKQPAIKEKSVDEEHDELSSRFMKLKN